MATPFQCSFLKSPHGQRSLAGYSRPWGHTELDTTEWLTLSLSKIYRTLSKSVVMLKEARLISNNNNFNQSDERLILFPFSFY